MTWLMAGESVQCKTWNWMKKKKKKGIHEHRLLGKKQGRRYGEKEIKEKNMVNQKREHDLDDIE